MSEGKTARRVERQYSLEEKKKATRKKNVSNGTD